jgi:hypothetical protein
LLKVSDGLVHHGRECMEKQSSSYHGEQEEEKEGEAGRGQGTADPSNLLPPGRFHLLKFPKPLKIVPLAGDQVPQHEYFEETLNVQIITGIKPKKLKSYVLKNLHMVVYSRFIPNCQTWKQPRYPSLVEWTNYGILLSTKIIEYNLLSGHEKNMICT